MTNDPASLPDWLGNYIANTGAELLQDESTQALYDRLAGLNGDEVNFRANEIRRLLRNSGFAEADENQRWKLDPLPLLVSADAWQTLSAGIEQRIRLLNQLVIDLNGTKQTLTTGSIPASLLMRHPYYLPECQNLMSGKQGIFLTAFDIGQDKSGQFYVLNDHCQFPRGLGLLLENRIVARRVMSEEFAECGVQRIAGFFEQLQIAINQAATRLNDPRVVILSRGPEDPYYSEQAYLATYLGYTLVRSADLTVRKGQVWLKALDGLRKVDVILRWIEDRFLDSLEQVEYSEYGIPGLLHAVRQKSVILLNPLGNGLVQIPAVRNHLQDAASFFGHAKLLLKQQETFAFEDVQAPNYDQYELLSYIDPALKLNGIKDDATIQRVLEQHQQSDLFWRKKIQLTEAPFWHAGKLVAKPIITRCYALLHNDQVSLLPSALCYTPSSANKNGKIEIKDTWVQTIGPHLPASATQVQLPRRAADLALMEGLLPSRTAENLYWLGCALERCEDLVRLLRLFIDRFTELAIYPDPCHKNTLIRLKSGLLNQSLLYPYHQFDEAWLEEQPNLGDKALVIQLMQDDTLAGGLNASMNMVAQSALQVRELLSYDSLRIIENIEEEHSHLASIVNLTPTHSLQSTLDRTIELIMAFNGSILDSLSTSNGSFMLEIGRRLERCTQLVAMIQTMLRTPLPDAEQQSALEAVLVAQVSSVTHRRRYRMYQSVDTGLELLLLDAEYPRSLAYQIEQLAKLCKCLPSKNKPGFLTTTEKILLQLRASFALADRTTFSVSENNSRTGLAALLESVSLHLQKFTEMLHTQYFSHTKVATKLNWSGTGSPVPTIVTETDAGVDVPAPVMNANQGEDV
ncbi:circularly permuted type 2 ATP-grasp protein [Aestuariibacter salexigens]|uniref:circularly permuted type 2 ATP-grasp protein n=1 Tax=Aestuariibacter salexigens TaxID=226010 RepID=UPI0004065703|nr:circularly permuted type 2 ATP-grasp protein [Aestuariibacter salexigens]